MSDDTLQIASRRTIMDGEVVTIAIGFKAVGGMIGTEHEAYGPFEISASRNAVIVHQAVVRTVADCYLLIDAIRFATAVRMNLGSQRDSQPSRYPSKPTTISAWIKAKEGEQ
jgi:hypothetical protein